MILQNMTTKETKNINNRKDRTQQKYNNAFMKNSYLSKQLQSQQQSYSYNDDNNNNTYLLVGSKKG